MGALVSWHRAAGPRAAVLNLMVRNGLGERPLLICHSLGGLVAKQVLRKASDAARRAPRKGRCLARPRWCYFWPRRMRAQRWRRELAKAFSLVFGSTVTIVGPKRP